jgi:hypothetical protein
MRLNLKILVFMTALAVFQHLGGRGYDYRESILPPIASAIRDASHRKSHGDAMIHGPVAFAVPFIAACLFAVLRLLSIWSPRLDHYLWLLAVFVPASLLVAVFTSAL